MKEDMAAGIALYHRLFIVCLILFLVCLAVAVVLFFALDIADALSYLTGHRKRKRILQLNKAASEGKKRQPAERYAVKYYAEESHIQESQGTMTEKLSSDATNIHSRQQGTFKIEREMLLIHTEEII